MSSVLSEEHFHNEEAAFAFVESWLWPTGPVCPFCGCAKEHVGRLHGVMTKPSKKNPEGKPVIGLHKCYGCRKQFTVRVGSIFEESHLPLHMWLQAIYLLSSSKKGISTRQIQRTLGVGMKTAWHLTHRIRECMAPGNNLGPLGGEGKIVEADATFIGGKERNKHVGKRNPRAVGGIGKAAVHSLVERDGNVRSHHVSTVHSYVLRPIITRHVHRNSTLMTDTAGAYGMIGKQFARHESVNHAADEYVRRMPDDLVVHSNTVENYFSVLKRGLTGIYQAVSPAHLHRYLYEFDFRYSNREKLGVNDVARANRALVGAKGKRLTYRKASGAGA